MSTFYSNDTDDQIIQKKLDKEVQMWISHLDYVSIEADRLAKIASNKLQAVALRDRILSTIDSNVNLLNELYNYRNSLENFNECDALECDMFYLGQHDTLCDRYLKHVSEYRILKDEVYLELLTS